MFVKDVEMSVQNMRVKTTVWNTNNDNGIANSTMVALKYKSSVIYR